MKKPRHKPSPATKRRGRLNQLEAQSLQAISFAAAPVEWVEAAGEGEEKKLKTFSMVAYTGGALRVAAFFRPVVVDLAGMNVRATMPVLRNHDPDLIVGHSTETEKGQQKLKIKGQMSGVGESAAEIVALAANGFPWQASIGASVEQAEFVDAGNTVKVNGKNFSGPLVVARKSTLREVSFVPIGADENASAKVAAAHQKEKATMTFEEWLAAKDFEADSLSDSQKETLEAAWKAEVKAKAKKETPSDNAPPPKRTEGEFDEFVNATKTERERMNAIQALATAAIKQHPSQVEMIEKMVATAALQSTVDARQFELELLRATRPQAVSNLGPSLDGESNARVIEAAICKSLGLREIDKAYDERTLDATDRHFRNGIGLQELLFKAAAANGQVYHSAGNLKGLLKAAFGEIQASGFSTFSLPGILSNVANKMLKDFFNSVDSAWRQISAITPVRDFKQIDQYSLTGDLQYEKLGAAGEIKHGTLGEEKYTNQADTYAKMLAITRRDIINDDLGAFQRIPRRLGRGAALKINDVFWTVFLNNSTFFTAGNKNVSTGAGSALGAADGAAINAAEVVFFNQTDPDSKPLGIRPRIMLVPPTLWNTALRWMGSQRILPSGTTGLGEDNVFAGRYIVVTSPYMENSTYTGNSTAAWYLLADPMDMPVIETVFLNGRDMPVVESAEADFDVLGIQFRGYHDFGVAFQEFRGGVRSAGS